MCLLDVLTQITYFALVKSAPFSTLLRFLLVIQAHESFPFEPTVYLAWHLFQPMDVYTAIFFMYFYVLHDST